MYEFERHGLFYLNLSWEEYYQMVNPDDKLINNGVRPRLYVADMEGMYNSVEIYRNYYLSSGERLAIKKCDEGVWGEIDERIVGFATILNENEIDLTVAVEYQKKGIGTKLLLEFRKDHPFALSGGYTEDGLSAEKKVFKYLQRRIAEQRAGL